jgi:hypothetical protein
MLKGDKKTENVRFLPAEYIEQIREYATLVSTNLNDLKYMIKTRIDPTLEPNLQKTLNVLDRMHFLAKEGKKNLERLNYPDSLSEAKTVQARLDVFNRAFRCLSQAAFQALETSMSEQTYFKFLTLEQHEYRKALISIEILMEFLLDSYFPEYLSKKSVIIPLFGDSFGYQVFMLEEIAPRVALVEIPRVDACRCRFWSWLGHEAFHSRYRLGFRDEEWETARSQIVDDIKNLGIRRWGINSPKIAARQLKETICDTAALRLLGPSYLLALSTTYMNPRSEASSFDAHPPMTARVHYLLKLLEKIGDPSTFSNFLDKMGKSWNTELSSCGISYKEGTYIEEYEDMLSHYENVLVKLSSVFSPLIDKRQFDSQCWKRSKRIYAKWREGGSLLNYDLDLAELLNIVWLKRMDDFDEVYPSEKQKSHFVALCKLDEKMTDQMIWYIHDRMRNQDA